MVVLSAFMIQQVHINFQDNQQQKRKEKIMLEKFKQYLVACGLKEYSPNGSPSTAVDYKWRLEKICLREGMTEQQLADNINNVLEEYDRAGEKWCVGRRSHESYINALRHFRKFVLVQRFQGATNG